MKRTIEKGKQYRVNYPTDFGVGDLHSNHGKLVTVKSWDPIAEQWQVIGGDGRSIYYYPEELDDPTKS